MNTQEFVENYIKCVKTKLIKFLLSLVAIDSATVIIIYFIFIKLVNIENNPDTMLFLFGAIILIAFYFSVYVSAKLNFGSFKNFKKETRMHDRYKAAIGEYKKTDNKTVFDEKLSELEMLIKENQ